RQFTLLACCTLTSFLFTVTPTTEISPLSLHDALPILFLEHYPGMTEQVIQGLIDEASRRWDVQRARVIHRIGRLALADQIVFVGDRKSTRLNSSHVKISYAVFCLKKKTHTVSLSRVAS